MALLLAADNAWQKGFATFLFVLLVVGLVAGGYRVMRWFAARRGQRD